MGYQACTKSESSAESTVKNQKPPNSMTSNTKPNNLPTDTTKGRRTSSSTTDPSENPQDLPSVTIVVPTYRPRHMFHELLYETFLRQKYPPEKLELLVFDNGDSPSTFFDSKKRDRVRYHYDPSAVTLGEKRNWLVENASNSIIVSFDDDDFYSENYVKTMVTALVSNPILRLAKLKSWPMATFGPHGNALQFNFVSPDYTDYGWGFSWVYHKNIFSSSKCRFAKTNYAEEDSFAACIDSHFGKDSIERLSASETPYILLKFEDVDRYLGLNAPLKWANFHVDNATKVTQDKYSPSDWLIIQKYIALFKFKVKTNLAGNNKIPVASGCEAGGDFNALRKSEIAVKFLEPS
jgi:glycosyltransferase involved in cell wall biosynthesis